MIRNHTSYRIHGAVRLLRLLLVSLAVGVLLPGVLAAQRTEREADEPVAPTADSMMRVERFEYIDHSDSAQYSHSQVDAARGGTLDSIVRIGSTLPASCSDVALHAAGLTVRLDVGEDDLYGSNAFAVDADLNLTWIDTAGASVLGPTNAVLHIDQDAPEQVFHIDYHGADSTAFLTADRLRIDVNNYSCSALVAAAMRLKVSYLEETAIGARDAGSPSTALVSPVASGGTTKTGNPVTFEWDLTSGCDTFPSYQLQILRLYNIDPAVTTESAVKARVDWNEALTVETPNGKRSIALTLAEGTGYYLWRVRPIGSLYPGGIADARNWGVWSSAPAQGSAINYTSPTQTGPTISDAAFYYEQFDHDKNWQYGRTFAEDGRISEGMSFYTGGGIGRQAQARIAARDSVMSANAVADYDGRTDLGMLPVPLPYRTLSTGGLGYLGYADNTAQHGSDEYAARHFDADSTIRNPGTVDAGNVADHFSDYNMDPAVPNSGGYPFSRTLFSTDGSGRTAEASGTGPVHRLGSTMSGQERTVKIYYSGVADAELVRLFGDEAPIDTAVYKVLTQSADKVTAVAYVAFDGGVIAAGLQRTMGDTLLAPLNESNTLAMTVSDTVRGNRARGPFSFAANKRLAFTDSTDVTLTYRIKPDTIHSDACGDLCTTCDYRVRLIVHNVEHPELSQEHVLSVGPDECGAVGTRTDTMTLHLAAGTYIFERRADANTVDSATISASVPYGTSYQQEFRDRVAGVMDSVIRENDTLQEIFRLLALDPPDFDSLYSFLDVNPLEVTSKTIHTSCCDVEVPILDPKCGFDPCRDSTPDFEGYLISRWKDKFAAGADSNDLNRYFKHDGAGRYTSPPPAYPNGKGAFNFMVSRMLAERNPDSSHVYDCGRLWQIWTGLVGAFDRLSLKDPDGGEFNPDFDLLDAFLSAAGYRLVDTTNTGYDSTRGYFTLAYKYFHHSINPSGACELATGYNAGWAGNLDSADRWLELKQCYDAHDRTHTSITLDDGCDNTGSHPDVDTCLARKKRQYEAMGVSECESRIGTYQGMIAAAYAGAGTPITPEEALCMAWVMVDSCRNGAHLTLFTHTAGGGAIWADSLGTAAEWEQLWNIWRLRPIVSVPESDGMGGHTCADTAAVLYEGWRQARGPIVVSHLNTRLEEFRSTVGADGAWWNYKPAMREVAPDSIVNAVLDSMVFVPLKFTSAFRVDSCRLYYDIDAIDATPESPHPMVGHLNNLLNAVWALPIPSADTASCKQTTQWYDSVDYEQVAYGLSNAAIQDSAARYLSTQFRFVNGDIGYHALRRYVRFLVYQFQDSGYARTAWKSSSESQYRATGWWGLASIDSITRAPEFDNGDTWPWKCSGDCDIVTGYIWRPHNCVSLDSVNDYHLIMSLFQADSVEPTFPSPVMGNYFIYRVDSVGLGPLRNYLNNSFTQIFGEYGQDEEGYLTFHFKTDELDTTYSNAWQTYSDTTIRVHNIHFDVLHIPGGLSKLLSNDVCDTLSCPSVCLHWGPAVMDSSRVDPIIPEKCEETAARAIRSGIERGIRACIDAQLGALEGHYRERCLDGDRVDDELILSYPIDYYHFTLFYHDRAGNLVKTVPPKGVQPLSVGATRSGHPSHTFVSAYEYDGDGRLIRAETPDAGVEKIWYDHLGRPRFGQSQRDRDSGQYTYVRYDRLGRVVESGVSRDSAAAEGFASRVDMAAFPGTGSERSYIAYDTTSGVNYLDGTPQTYLRGRVSEVYNDDSVHTHYSYDPHGMLVWTAQQIPGLPGPNFVKYEYDLPSGNVREVKYNEGRRDGFRHRYDYDADGNLSVVRTSRDGVVWDTDVRYYYNPDGSLRRRELGEDRLQGLDYVYTLDGALKAINSPSLDCRADVGADGNGGSPFPADSFAAVLHYYRGDFARSMSPFDSSDALTLNGPPLYGGGITGVSSNIGRNTGAHYDTLSGETYRYDQAGRLVASEFVTKDSHGDWASTGEYATSYAYDANGNLDSLRRAAFDSSGTHAMDSLAYSYTSGKNRLERVQDAVTGDPYREDVNNGQAANNYVYDGSGNLVRDNQEKLDMFWNADRSVDRVERRPTANRWTIATYTYDALGNRVRSELVNHFPVATGTLKKTFYVTDAAGTVMAIYEVNCEGATCDTALVEIPIYGLEREGAWMPQGITPGAAPTDSVYTRALGAKFYELKDHLGNVRAVMTDRKLSDVPGGTPIAFRAEILRYSNLYPFGMEQPGRYYAGTPYRYGYQGMEQDTGATPGDHFTTFFRQYDARLGRWWGIDPVTNPSESPYAAMGNSPAMNMDQRGDTPTVSLDAVARDAMIYSNEKHSQESQSKGTMGDQVLHELGFKVPAVSTVTLRKSDLPTVVPHSTVVERVWHVVTSESYLDRAHDYASDHHISPDNIFEYPASQEQGHGGTALVMETKYSATFNTLTVYKHVFREAKKGVWAVFTSSLHDDLNQRWNNSLDANGMPILTEADKSAYVMDAPGFGGFSGATALERGMVAAMARRSRFSVLEKLGVAAQDYFNKGIHLNLHEEGLELVLRPSTDGTLCWKVWESSMRGTSAGARAIRAATKELDDIVVRTKLYNHAIRVIAHIESNPATRNSGQTVDELRQIITILLHMGVQHN